MNNIEKINKFLKEDDGPIIALPKVNLVVLIKLKKFWKFVRKIIFYFKK